METAAASSDKAIGLTILLSIVALLGVVGMFIAGLTGDQLIAAVGFGVAIIAGSLAVSATHLFE
jgi:protein-S-isoprenylcysteine O-methyltransferase Ste14